MNRSMLLLAAGIIALGPLASPATSSAQNAPAAPPRMAASSFASVEVHINSRRIAGQWYDEDAGLTGPARIAITYGQPHARGRKVEGGLIPLDTVWRFGANTATTLHTDVDITLGKQKVAQGDYSMFILYRNSGWQLLLSRATGQWGTDYDSTKVIGRIPLASKQLAEPEEALTIYLVPDAAKPGSGYADLRGTMLIKWGKTELSAPWRVDQ
jgi:hypothetical protein